MSPKNEVSETETSITLTPWWHAFDDALMELVPSAPWPVDPRAPGWHHVDPARLRRNWEAIQERIHDDGAAADHPGSKLHDYARRAHQAMKAMTEEMEDPSERLEEPGARLFIKTKKLKKREQIKVLLAELQDVNKQLNEMADRFQKYIGQHIAKDYGHQFVGYPHDVHPGAGDGIFFATYNGFSVLAWWTGSDWFIQRPDHHGRERIVEDNPQLTWYKKIS